MVDEVLDPPTQLAAPRSVAELRTQFRQGKAELLARFAASRATAPAATRLIKALTLLVDDTLLAAWHHAGMPASTALLAVGGYGRAELLPYSDVDVLVLLPPRNVAVERDSIKCCSNAALPSRNMARKATAPAGAVEGACKVAGPVIAPASSRADIKFSW